MRSSRGWRLPSWASSSWVRAAKISGALGAASFLEFVAVAFGGYLGGVVVGDFEAVGVEEEALAAFELEGGEGIGFIGEDAE